MIFILFYMSVSKRMYLTCTINAKMCNLKSILMKKILTLFSALALTGALFAGGLVTNTNQSALYTRLQNRNASTDIDAVYYNPAGLTKLGDGFHFSLNNQTIGQTRDIITTYSILNGTPKDYKGTVSAPIYPDVYAVFNKGKLSFSFGFCPVGGGGGATYKQGLPSLEMPIADLKSILTSMGLNTTEYSADLYFKGSSVYFGYQVNVAYEINDIWSIAAGVRLVTAKNTYKGSIENIMINPIYAGNPTGANMIPAPTFFTAIGQPTYAAKTSDRYADAEMTGKGFAPIISVNITPSEKLNFSIKYEFKTPLELKTTVNDNKSAGMFIQDSTAIADMPALLAVGINFRPINKLLLSGSFNYYFDKAVDYDGQSDVENVLIDKNFVEGGLGIEYGLTEKLRASAGWVATFTGVNDEYNSDMEYSTNTNSFGAGFGYRVTPKIDINLGGSYTFYKDGSEDYTSDIGLQANNVYKKKTWIIGVGVDLNF
jgi:long-chain fatty acid transport protein